MLKYISLQVPNVNEPIVINASGKGVAFGQISYHYNVFNVDNIKPFTCHKEVYQKTGNDLTLNLCCKLVTNFLTVFYNFVPKNYNVHLYFCKVQPEG